MKQMEYFGQYQPLDGRIDFLCRRAFKDREDFLHQRIYCREDDGIFTIITDKKSNKHYHLKVTKKKLRPREEPIKEAPKKAITEIFLEWCKKNEVFSEKTFNNITTFSKGIIIEDEEEEESSLYALDLIKKARLPK